jgi:hypothetical protein
MIIATTQGAWSFESPYEKVDGKEVSFGYMTGAQYIEKDLFLHPLSKETFRRYITPSFDMRDDMPEHLPKDFQPLIKRIESYVTSNKGNRQGSLGDYELAKFIVRASFCSGTDPFIVTAKIHKESTFNNRAVSPTGAVGYTQMTAYGIEEVHDQLGNRGRGHAPLVNTEFFSDVVKCTLPGFVTPWRLGVIGKGQKVLNSTRRNKKIKNWLRSNPKSDLIYGQILLKTILASTYKPSLSLMKIYRRSLSKYNGDNNFVRRGPYKGQRVKVAYASQVVRFYEQVSN